MGMEIKDIKELVKLVSNSNITELSIGEGEEKIVIKHESKEPSPQIHPNVQNVPLMPYSSYMQPNPVIPNNLMAPNFNGIENGNLSGIAEVKKQPAEQKSNLHLIKAPLVGTFYRSPAPDAPTYINKGDKIKKGQTLCIIEAMKLMNEIESDVDGTVVKVIVDNAASVEYGSELIEIMPD